MSRRLLSVWSFESVNQRNGKPMKQGVFKVQNLLFSEKIISQKYNTVNTLYSEVLNLHYMVNLDKNGQKSSLYGETSLYSEEIPYSELFSKIHYVEYPL